MKLLRATTVALLIACASAAATAPCTGASVDLSDTECMVWQNVFDTLNGNAWSNCSDTRNDPCSCKTLPGRGVLCGSGMGSANDVVPCTADKCNILTIQLANPACTGMEGRILPPSISNLKELVALDIEGCKVAGPVPDSFKSLTKLKTFQVAQNRLTSLPSLDFDQYSGWCDVCDNPFVCPLPLGASDCHDNDCPPSCITAGPTPAPATPCAQKCAVKGCTVGCLDSNYHCWSPTDIPENTCKQHLDFCWC